MRLEIVLDAGPLSEAPNLPSSGEGERCRAWLRALIVADHRVGVPAISDYEVRRELLRAGKIDGIERLDRPARDLKFLPLSPWTLRVAARLWANARNTGLTTAEDAALDGDVILAAQAIRVGRPGRPVVVATKNVRHLDRYVDARYWESIS